MVTGRVGSTGICGLGISLRGAVVLLAVLAMAVGLAACGGGEEATARPEATEARDGGASAPTAEATEEMEPEATRRSLLSPVTAEPDATEEAEDGEEPDPTRRSLLIPATAEPDATEEAEDKEEPDPTRRPTLAPPAVTSVETDREALTALYNATGGPDWNDNGGWLSEGPLDSWHGVRTDDDDRVIGLYFGPQRVERGDTAGAGQPRQPGGAGDLGE